MSGASPKQQWSTNMIMYDGRRLPARIDETARINTVIETMARSFGAREQAITLCLRDSADRLVTQANLAKKVDAEEPLKLVLAPEIEALKVILSLKRELAHPTSSASTASHSHSRGASGSTIPAGGGGGGSSSAHTSPTIPAGSTFDTPRSGAGGAGSASGAGFGLGSEPPGIKLALFNVSKFAKEDEFAVDFVLKGGMRLMLALLVKDGGVSGNMLAYALEGVRGLLNYDAAWDDLSVEFIDCLLYWLSTSTAPNILRPTTAMLRKIFMSASYVVRENGRGKRAGGKGRVAAGGADAKGKGKSNGNGRGGEDDEGTDLTFEVLWGRVRRVGARLGQGHGLGLGPGPGHSPNLSLTSEQEQDAGAERVLRAVVKRLEGTGDLELVSQSDVLNSSIGLINAALRGGQQCGGTQYDELVTIVEHLSVRKFISRLVPTAATQNIEQPILGFQTRYAAILQHRRERAVHPREVRAHERVLAELWTLAKLGKDAREGALASAPRTSEGWARLGMGLGADDVGEGHGRGMRGGEGEMFRDVGELGMECLHWFVVHDENVLNIIAEQQAKPADRRCPIGRACAACVMILCEHYKLASAGKGSASRSAAHFQTHLLQFPRLNHLVLTFFLRMWHESEAAIGDFSRVAALVRAQLARSLEHEAGRSWLALEQDLLDSEYREIRERQMEMMEKEDGMMETEAVRALRGGLEREAFAVLSAQRVGCLMQGAWFNAPTLVGRSIQQGVKPNPMRPLRFVRLSPNRRTLAWSDFATRPKSDPAYDVLRERLDVRTINEVREHTGHAVKSRAPGVASRLCFSLMLDQYSSALDLDAVHAAQYAEWVDGVREVARLGVGNETDESRGYIKVLADLGVKMRLLDITGDGIDIPAKVRFGPAPTDCDFWFAK